MGVVRFSCLSVGLNFCLACNVSSELSGATGLPLNPQLCRKPDVYLASLRRAEVRLMACLGVFQAKDVSLRSSCYPVMAVLAEEMWSNWSDRLQRTEDRFSL